MNGPAWSRRSRLVVAGVLTVGWAVAIAVYLSASSPVEVDPEISDWEHSRIYERQLQVIGGKSAVFGAELNEWFAGLWHGKALAYTIATITGVIALGCYGWDRARPDSREG